MAKDKTCSDITGNPALRSAVLQARGLGTKVMVGFYCSAGTYNDCNACMVCMVGFYCSAGTYNGCNARNDGCGSIYATNDEI